MLILDLNFGSFSAQLVGLILGLEARQCIIVESVVEKTIHFMASKQEKDETEVPQSPSKAGPQ